MFSFIIIAEMHSDLIFHIADSRDHNSNSLCWWGRKNTLSYAPGKDLNWFNMYEK